MITIRPDLKVLVAAQPVAFRKGMDDGRRELEDTNNAAPRDVTPTEERDRV